MTKIIMDRHRAEETPVAAVKQILRKTKKRRPLKLKTVTLKWFATIQWQYGCYVLGDEPIEIFSHLHSDKTSR